MSFEVVNAVLDYSEAELSCRLVMVVLAERASPDGVSWPSQVEIADKARVTVRTVTTCLRDLEAAGEVETRKAQVGRVRLNVYRLRLPCVHDEVDYDRLERAGLKLVEPFTTGNVFHPSERDHRKSAARRPEICSRIARPLCT